MIEELMTLSTIEPDSRVALVRSQPEGTHVYVCGPEGLMDAVIETALSACVSRGVDRLAIDV